MWRPGKFMHIFILFRVTNENHCRVKKYGTIISNCTKMAISAKRIFKYYQASSRLYKQKNFG